ncbi:MAG: hypothetical protein OCU12_07060 [Methanophagales archaeon]|nr:hypothetical protein [Methanophagales archaeon]
MAETTYDEVPQHGQFRQDLQYAVKEDDTVVEFQVVAWHTTAGYITATTTATSGRAAGIAQEPVTATQSDYSSGYPIVRIPVMFHGVSKFIAGADSSVTVGMWLVLEGTDGRLVDAGAVSQTLYVTHGIALDNPDADGEYGHIMLNLNVPYYSAVT